MCSGSVLVLLCLSVSLLWCFCLHFLSLVPVSLVCLFVSIVTLVCSYDNCPCPLVISLSLSVCVYLNGLVFTCVCLSLFHPCIVSWMFLALSVRIMSFCLFLIKVVLASGFSLPHPYVTSLNIFMLSMFYCELNIGKSFSFHFIQQQTKKLHSISGIRVVYYFSYYIIYLLKRKIYLKKCQNRADYWKAVCLLMSCFFKLFQILNSKV